jgi:hypothetical protein
VDMSSSDNGRMSDTRLLFAHTLWAKWKKKSSSSTFLLNWENYQMSLLLAAFYFPSWGYWMAVNLPKLRAGMSEQIHQMTLDYSTCLNACIVRLLFSFQTALFLL